MGHSRMHVGLVNLGMAFGACLIADETCRRSLPAIGMARAPKHPENQNQAAERASSGATWIHSASLHFHLYNVSDIFSTVLSSRGTMSSEVGDEKKGELVRLPRGVWVWVS